MWSAASRTRPREVLGFVRFAPIPNLYERAEVLAFRAKAKNRTHEFKTTPREGTVWIAVNLVQCKSVCQVFFRDYEIHNRVREEWCQKSHRHTFTFTHTRSHTEDGVRVASPTSAHARPLAARRSVGARTTR